MTEAMLMEVMKLTIETAAMLSAPIIGTVVIVGLISQVLQSVTQMKDQALSFVPKVLIAGIVFVLLIPWYIQIIQRYVEIIFGLIGRAAV
ncbi:MAG: hypothetical protein A2X49_02840 [Lentisphaerae bacterium GWF2_52_8]|nr:MAG: hypothetical protein A2X49_02840 [Lentisphaerae bacterium GWF2_52_8]